MSFLPCVLLVSYTEGAKKRLLVLTCTYLLAIQGVSFKLDIYSLKNRMDVPVRMRRLGAPKSKVRLDLILVEKELNLFILKLE